MNLQHLHGYFTVPSYRLLVCIANPLTDCYRPLGGIFYRVLYGIFGFNPLPLRIASFFFLALNLFLSYRLLSRLSPSSEVALLGSLALAYHACMSDLYYSTGTIYDILCFTLYVTALLFYVRQRQRNRPSTLTNLACLAGLQLLALQAKEMACTLPLAILLLEVCYRRDPRSAGLHKLSVRAAAIPSIAITAALSIAVIAFRTTAPGALTANPLYHVTLSPLYYLRSAAIYQNMILYSPGLFRVRGLICLWLLLAVLAAAFRSRQMAWGLSFWAVSITPVALIPARSGFVLYLPMLGLALFFGAFLSRLRHLIARILPQYLNSRIFVFFCTVMSLLLMHIHERAIFLPAILQPQQDLRNLMAQLSRMHPVLVTGAHVFFEHDPFGADDWLLPFCFRLRYKDPDIRVERARNHPHAQAYDYVFDFSGGRLTELPGTTANCREGDVASLGAVDDSSLGICWTGKWASGTFPRALNGTLTYTRHEGATATLRFFGSSLTYVYTKASNRGMARILIDGADFGIIDLYSARTIWQARTVFNGLRPDYHFAEVLVLNRRRPAATDVNVDVDAFLVSNDRLQRSFRSPRFGFSG